MIELARWQARELDELREYLGEDYDHATLEGHAQAVQAERAVVETEAELYRSSHAYLYDLTVFAMSGTKRPYLDVLRRRLRPGSRVLDYGCGIGSDGLTLLEEGYEVTFADFDNPSTRYLRWRLKRRGLEAAVYDLDRERPPDGFDVAYAFDVIEHVDDPFTFLADMERSARRVLVNFLVDEHPDNSLHRPLPLWALLDRAAERRLLHYGRFHGRSHLVFYDRRKVVGARRLQSRATLWRATAATRAADTLRRTVAPVRRRVQRA